MQLAPSALHAAGEAVAHLLGPWELADPGYDGTVHLHGPLERHIGMRLIQGGNTVQLWVTGGTQPADHQPGSDLVPLPKGQAYNTAVHLNSLTEEQDPAVLIYTALSENLLPVFDAKPSRVGHRPWETSIEADVEATVQAAAAAGVDVGDQPEPQPQQEPEPAAEPAATPEPAPQDPADELAAKRTRKRTTTNPAPAAAAAADKPKPARPARKRTSTKPATS
ncbi:hypothetical protein ACFWVC_26995 [Streptomyces sp. NPDC058691]|uniref:hypothetical protein n=1 Tax=Streptomyces sp. NPDC058691 TaxID=3346601 RepID=UPI0036530F94